MHGGAIGFASQSGVGSTFAFYIKSRRGTASRRQSENNTVAAGLNTQKQVSELPERAYKEKTKPPATPVKNEIPATSLHVLVVEDNLVNQRVLAKQLRNLGMTVSVANHGGEALEHLRTTTYCNTDGASAKKLSLVLMDWEMPVRVPFHLYAQDLYTNAMRHPQVMDGLTCVRRIRELQKEGVVKGHVPVIAVTANVRGEQVKIAMKAGMDDVISKPFRIPELSTCIQKTLGRLT
jgi:CheY-like chemotaxis protein